MKVSIKLFFITSLFLSALVSCKDKNPPTITIISPIEDAHYQVGTSFHYEANIEDDRGIATYRMYIGDQYGVPASSFSLTGSGDIVSKEKDYLVQGNSDIPLSANGEYYIYFEATDRDGKSAQLSRRFFVDP